MKNKYLKIFRTKKENLLCPFFINIWRGKLEWYAKNGVSFNQETVIEYTAVTVAEMVEMLESNAMKAEATYQDQYVEITGRLGNIDSDGKYITLYPSTNL